MKNKLHILIMNIFVVVALIALSGCATTTNPNTLDELSKVKSIAVLPSDVYVGLSKLASDDERMTDLEEERLNAIKSLSKEAVINTGYEYIDFDYQSEIQDNEDFAFLITQFKDDLKIALEDKNKWAPVGDSARELSSVIGSDALLLTNYNGVRKSSGEISKDIGASILIGVLTAGAVIPVSQTQAGTAQAYLVDGISGDILWQNTTHGQETSTIAKTTLSKLPKK